MFEKDLMAGRNAHLAAIDPEEDAAMISSWTEDARFRLLMEFGKNRGWTPVEMKKHYEKHLNDSDEHRNEFHFSIRANVDDRLTGVFSIPWVGWSNRVLIFRLGFGDLADTQNWGSEVLKLAFGYLFGELNMHLVTMRIPEFSTEMIEMAKDSGMSLTTRRREVLYFNGRYHDSLWFSFLRPDWLKTIELEAK